MINNLHQRLTELIEADSVPMSDAWGRLLDDIQMVDEARHVTAPVEFPAALEEAVRRCGLVSLHKASKMLDAAFVIAPRVRFEKTDKGLIVLRGDEVVGTMFHWKDGDLWFLEIPGHPQGDRPGIRGEMTARATVQDILDKPA